MEHNKDQSSPGLFGGYIWLIAALIIVLSLGALNIYQYNQNTALNNSNLSLVKDLETSNSTLASIKSEKENLTKALNEAAAKSQNFAAQLDVVNNTVERYQRLSRLDPELLEKYSKVFFLSENYIPAELTDIDTKYLSNKSRPLQIHDRVWPFLSNLLTDANAAGIQLQISSAYRSFGTQATLKSAYKVTYGSGANSFSAEQGYSEHQLGTTADFTTPAIGGGLTGFDKTDAYKWLNENAYKYGFVLSYPKTNAYYIFEPWHWRFVGLDLALKLHNEGKNFYDLDQRDINTYLINIFSAMPSQPKLP